MKYESMKPTSNNKPSNGKHRYLKQSKKIYSTLLCDGGFCLLVRNGELNDELSAHACVYTSRFNYILPGNVPFEF